MVHQERELLHERSRLQQQVGCEGHSCIRNVRCPLHAPCFRSLLVVMLLEMDGYHVQDTVADTSSVL